MAAVTGWSPSVRQIKTQLALWHVLLLLSSIATALPGPSDGNAHRRWLIDPLPDQGTGTQPENNDDPLGQLEQSAGTILQWSCVLPFLPWCPHPTASGYPTSTVIVSQTGFPTIATTQTSPSASNSLSSSLTSITPSSSVSSAPSSSSNTVSGNTGTTINTSSSPAATTTTTISTGPNTSTGTSNSNPSLTTIVTTGQDGKPTTSVGTITQSASLTTIVTTGQDGKPTTSVGTITPSASLTTIVTTGQDGLPTTQVSTISSGGTTSQPSQVGTSGGVGGTTSPASSSTGTLVTTIVSTGTDGLPTTSVQTLTPSVSSSQNTQSASLTTIITTGTDGLPTTSVQTLAPTTQSASLTTIVSTGTNGLPTTSVQTLTPTTQSPSLTTIVSTGTNGLPTTSVQTITPTSQSGSLTTIVSTGTDGLPTTSVQTLTPTTQSASLTTVISTGTDGLPTTSVQTITPSITPSSSVQSASLTTIVSTGTDGLPTTSVQTLTPSSTSSSSSSASLTTITTTDSSGSPTTIVSTLAPTGSSSTLTTGSSSSSTSAIIILTTATDSAGSTFVGTITENSSTGPTTTPPPDTSLTTYTTFPPSISWSSTSASSNTHDSSGHPVLGPWPLCWFCPPGSNGIVLSGIGPGVYPPGGPPPGLPTPFPPLTIGPDGDPTYPPSQSPTSPSQSSSSESCSTQTVTDVTYYVSYFTDSTGSVTSSATFSTTSVVTAGCSVTGTTATSSATATCSSGGCCAGLPYTNPDDEFSPDDDDQNQALKRRNLQRRFLGGLASPRETSFPRGRKVYKYIVDTVDVHKEGTESLSPSSMQDVFKRTQNGDRSVVAYTTCRFPGASKITENSYPGVTDYANAQFAGTVSAWFPVTSETRAAGANVCPVARLISTDNYVGISRSSVAGALPYVTAGGGSNPTFQSDHVYEFQILGKFFTYMLSRTDANQVRCADFNDWWWRAGANNQPHLANLYKYLAGVDYPDMAGIDGPLNGRKGWYYYRDGAWPSSRADTASLVQSIQTYGMVAALINNDAMVTLFQRTNTRIYNAFLGVDQQILADSCNANTAPGGSIQANWAEEYRAWIGSYLSTVGAGASNAAVAAYSTLSSRGFNAAQLAEYSSVYPPQSYLLRSVDMLVLTAGGTLPIKRQACTRSVPSSTSTASSTGVQSTTLTTPTTSSPTPTPTPTTIQCELHNQDPGAGVLTAYCSCSGIGTVAVTSPGPDATGPDASCAFTSTPKTTSFSTSTSIYTAGCNACTALNGGQPSCTKISGCTPSTSSSSSATPTPTLKHPDPANNKVDCYNSGQKSSNDKMAAAAESFCQYNLPPSSGSLLGPGFYLMQKKNPPGDFRIDLSVEVFSGCEWQYTYDECVKYLKVPIDSCNCDGKDGKQGGTVSNSCIKWMIDPNSGI